MSEKRQFQRVEFDGECVIEHNGRQFQARVRDVSVGGAYIVTAEKLKFGDPVKMVIRLPAIIEKGPRGIDGLVRWVRDDGFGLQFGPTGAVDTYALAELVARQSKQI